MGIATETLTVNGTQIPLDADGWGRMTMTTVGSYTVVATATDAAGNQTQTQGTLIVYNPNTASTLTVSITQPTGADHGTFGRSTAPSRGQA